MARDQCLDEAIFAAYGWQSALSDGEPRKVAVPEFGESENW
jgi:hypothetical protein